MTSWTGVLQGLMMYEDAKRAEADRAFEREIFERRLLEERRTALIPELRDMREARQARLETIRTAVGIGLSQETATALERSGQLNIFLSAYNENEGVDPQYIAALDNLVTTELTERGANDDTVAAAILAGTATDRDVTDPDQSLTAITEAIISAQSFEELEAAEERFISVPSSRTSIQPFDVDFGRMTGLEPAETKAIRRELAETLNTYFENSFEISADGDVIITQQAGPEVAQLFNEAERTARNLASGPQRQYTVTDAANYVSTQIERAATQAPQVDAGDMFTNFDLVLSDPTAYAEQFVVPPVGPRNPETVNPAEAVEDLGDETLFPINPFTTILDEEIRNQ